MGPTGNFKGMSLVAVGHPYGWESYKMGECKVLVGPEEETRMIGGRHISVSCPDRLPTWDEMLFIRLNLLPLDEDFILPLPRLSDYVNAHEYCLHLYSRKIDWNKAVAQE